MTKDESSSLLLTKTGKVPKSSPWIEQTCPGMAKVDKLQAELALRASFSSGSDMELLKLMSLKTIEEFDHIWLQLPNLPVRKAPETEQYPTIWKKKNQELKIKLRKNDADDTKELSLICSIMMILQFCFLNISFLLAI